MAWSHGPDAYQRYSRRSVQSPAFPLFELPLHLRVRTRVRARYNGYNKEGGRTLFSPPSPRERRIPFAGLSRAFDSPTTRMRSERRRRESRIHCCRVFDSRGTSSEIIIVNAISGSLFVVRNESYICIYTYIYIYT